jgi:hypothetical protein
MRCFRIIFKGLHRLVFRFFGGQSYYKAKEVHLAPLGRETKILLSFLNPFDH